MIQITSRNVGPGHGLIVRAAQLSRLIRLNRNFQAISRVGDVVSGMNTRDRRDYAPETSDFRFRVGMAIVAAAAIAIFLATNVPVVSEVAMFAAP